MRVIENATDLDGVVQGRQAHPWLPDRDLVTVEVGRAQAVPDRVDLLSSRVGTAVDVTVPRRLLPDGDLKGCAFHARCSLEGPGVVAATADPAGDAGMVSPPVR